ncbi:hypothetical protein ABT317_44310 [Streptomyces carpinensis]|uniref:Uncharacterized protein n=1 Tax=Streptomyces carpinensis TaxID=66369 RepID=A0ABV1WHY2_9ACTN
MDLDGRAAVADAEFDDPLRWPRSHTAAVFGFRLPFPDCGDLAVDARQPHGMPHPQRLQTLQIRRQVVEHVFDSRSMIQYSRPRVFDLSFDNVVCGRRRDEHRGNTGTR